MITGRALNPPEPKSGRLELARQPELHPKERELEQLRWRFAAIARRAATHDLGNAA